MVNARAHRDREADDPFTQGVLLRKFLALGDQGVALLFHVLLAILDLLASAQQLVAVDKGCLIEIDEAPFLGIGGVALTLEFGQLRLQQLVGDGLAARRHGVLAGQEHLRAQQGVADLFEDESVELIGTNIALRATAMFATGPEGIVVVAVVVPMERAVAPAHLVARHAHATVTALDQPA